MWERELRKIKGLYDNRLRASQQKSSKMEQALTNQTYQVMLHKKAKIPQTAITASNVTENIGKLWYMYTSTTSIICRHKYVFFKYLYRLKFEAEEVKIDVLCSFPSNYLSVQRCAQIQRGIPFEMSLRHVILLISWSIKT